MELWLEPKDVKYPHKAEIQMNVLNPFTYRYSASKGMATGSMGYISLSYVKVRLVNTEFPYVYVYVLKNQLDYFFSVYGLEEDREAQQYKVSPTLTELRK